MTDKETDKYFMQKVIKLAKNGQYTVHPNPMVMQ